MRKQRGAVELKMAVIAIVEVIVFAAFAGLWAYYHTQMSMLKKDNDEKAEVIKKKTVETSELAGKIAALTTANTNFVMQVQACTASVASITKERNDKAAEAKRAKAEAERKSIEFKRNASAILAQAAGVDWCKTWGSMVTDYTVMRQVKEPLK